MLKQGILSPSNRAPAPTWRRSERLCDRPVGAWCWSRATPRIPAAAEDLVQTAEAELGPVAVAVACAGQAMSAPLLRTEPSDLERLFAANTMSAFHLIKRAATAMIASRTRGRIVVVASTASVKGMRYTSAYCASKHAVLGLVRSAALELASEGSR